MCEGALVVWTDGSNVRHAAVKHVRHSLVQHESIVFVDLVEGFDDSGLGSGAMCRF